MGVSYIPYKSVDQQQSWICSHKVIQFETAIQNLRITRIVVVVVWRRVASEKEVKDRKLSARNVSNNSLMDLCGYGG